jgi:hypothetical protein
MSIENDNDNDNDNDTSNRDSHSDTRGQLDTNTPAIGDSRNNNNQTNVAAIYSVYIQQSFPKNRVTTNKPTVASFCTVGALFCHANAACPWDLLMSTYNKRITSTSFVSCNN